MDILILGCGYTGRRVAKRFLARGAHVTASTRDPRKLAGRGAAIYGPRRGVQESIRRGTHSVSERFVSRIHVDDLANHVEAGLLSSISGAYPVADEEPCTSLEIAEFCAQLLNVPAAGVGQGEVSRPARFAMNRRVDGSAVRRALGITLKYPSYRVGIPAALRGENAGDPERSNVGRDILCLL